MSLEIYHRLPEPGTYLWTAPQGVRTVRFIGFGAGGGGGGPQRVGQVACIGGGGGGGGGYVEGEVFVIEPGRSYAIEVGSGGEGGAPDIHDAYQTAINSHKPGGQGGRTSFSLDGEHYLIAEGGSGGEGGSVYGRYVRVPEGYDEFQPAKGGDGGNYFELVGATIGVRGKQGGVGGYGSGGNARNFSGRVKTRDSTPGGDIPSGGRGGTVGSSLLYGGDYSAAAAGGGGGGGGKGNGGNSGGCGGAGIFGTATGGGGGGGFEDGQASMDAPNAKGALTSGGKGGNGWAMLTYSIQEDVTDNPPTRI